MAFHWPTHDVGILRIRRQYLRLWCRARRCSVACCQPSSVPPTAAMLRCVDGATVRGRCTAVN
eukprot:612258-Lingulodinium_polyedra.AAC.1